MYLCVRKSANDDGSRDILAATNNADACADDKIPAWSMRVEIAGDADAFVWPHGSASAARLAADQSIVANPTVILPTDADRFDGERWVKATNLYWQEQIAQLVVALNQVRTDPLLAYPAVAAPTDADVKVGVVAQYQALGEG